MEAWELPQGLSLHGALSISTYIVIFLWIAVVLPSDPERGYEKCHREFLSLLRVVLIKHQVGLWLENSKADSQK